MIIFFTHISSFPIINKVMQTITGRTDFIFKKSLKDISLQHLKKNPIENRYICWIKVSIKIEKYGF